MNSMIIECKCELEGINTTWSVIIESFTYHGDYCEVVVTSKGSKFLFIVGIASNQNYICLPEYGFGCYLAHANDVFWNVEQISKCMNIIDATTIAMTISELYLHKSEFEKLFSSTII